MKRLILLLPFLVVSILHAQNPDPREALSHLDPRLRAAVARDLPDRGIRSGAPLPEIAGLDANGEPMYAVIVYCDHPEALPSLDWAIHSILPGFCTARLTSRQLLDVIAVPGIRMVKASGRMDYLNDLARSLTGADLLHAGMINRTEYKGKGVLVGVIDSGIDWKHLDFRSLSDSTKSRVVAIWDQTLTPGSGESSPSGFAYGVEYSQTHLNNELDGSPAGFVRSNDVNGHGTHVAGIAAGNGQSLPNRRYQGMAPEADILFVKTSMYTSDIVDGLTWLRAKATALGRPIAVNISLGSNDGPHDGTDAMSVGVDAFSGTGRVVAMAAGNSGGSPIHLSRTLPTGGTDSLLITVPAYTPLSGAGNDAFGIDLWHDGSGNLSFSVVSPLNDTVRCRANFDLSTTNNSGTLYLYNGTDPGNGDVQHYAYWYDSTTAKPPAAGVWKVFLSNASGSASTWHCWLWDWSIGNPAKTITLSGGDQTSTVNNTAATAVVAGSWVSRWRWTSSNGSNWLYSTTSDNSDSLSSFSSKGPTRTGAIKPDLAAPGQGIVSTSSSTIGVSASELMGNGKQRLTQGTSMASPVTCGAAALLLQRNPLLSGTDIRDLLQATATTDTMTRASLPSNHWGYGKLNVYRAMRVLTGISLPSSTALHAVDQWKSDNTLSVSAGTLIAVRFTPTWTARPATAYFHLGSTVGFTGSLIFEIWSDNGSGKPLAKLGSSVSIARADVLPFSWNAVSLTGTGLTLASGTVYHLVAYFTAGSTTSFSVDNGSPDGRSNTKSGASWASYANDLRLRPLLVAAVPTFAAGNYRIGGTGTTPSAGCQFVDLTAALADLATKELQGPTSLLLTSSYSVTEEDALPVTISALAGAGADARLRIAPDSATTITLSASSDTAILRLSGADYVDLDGSATGLSGRHLTLVNTSATPTSTVLRVQSPTASDGATHNTIRNLVLRGSGVSGTFAALYGGGSGVSTTDTALSAHSHTTVDNVLFQSAQHGMVWHGRSPAFPDDSLIVRSCAIGATGGYGLGVGGLLLRFPRTALVDGNEIQEVRGAGSGSVFGLSLQEARACRVLNTFIHGISYTGSSTTPVYGLTLSTTQFSTSSLPSSNLVAGTRIADLTSSGTSTSMLLSGINANGGYKDRYWHNTVHLTGTLGAGTGVVAAFTNGNPLVTTFSDSLDFRNSILQVNGTASAAAKFYAHYSRATSYATDIVNSNILRSVAAGSASASLGYINSAARSTLSQWRTASSADGLSLNVDPLVSSSTDVHIATGSGYDPVPQGSRAGQPLPETLPDPDGQSRDASAPDMGADEFTLSRTLTSSGTLPGFMGYDSITVNSVGITASLGGDVGIASALRLLGGSLSLGTRALTLHGTLEATSGLLVGGSSARLIVAGTGTALTLPTVTLRSLSLNRASGITLSGELTVNDTLRLTSGNLRLGPYDCALGAGIILPATSSASAMIVPTGSGFLTRAFTGPASFTFPVGDEDGTSEYTPVTMNFASGTFSSAKAGLRLADQKHPSNPALTNYLTRYWTLGQSGISAFSCTVTLRYTDADVVGTESKIFGSQNLPTGWTRKPVVNPTTNEIVIPGLTTF